MVAYLDGTDRPGDIALAAPQEEVEAWLAERGWHLAEVEAPGGRARITAEVAALASVAARKLAQTIVDQAAHEASILPDARLKALLAAQGLIAIARNAGRAVQVVNLPVGHNQMTEAPEETLAAIRDFLAR